MNNILKTEYSIEFDSKRKNAMLTSFFKYGALKENYARVDCPINATENIDVRLQKWKETGNKDYLVDVANFAMIAYMFEDGVYEPTDDEHILKGVAIQELRDFDGR